MPINTQIREHLEWASASRLKWEVAYQQAVERGRTDEADFAAKQIAMFDRFSMQFERLLR
jgi:hypothetical protein